MKKIIFILCLLIFSTQTAFAEKIPVKITPIQIISTHNDEIEVGDWIKFKVLNDVYCNDNIYINKDTIVTGIVDNVHENGIIADSTEIVFKKFMLRNANNDLITINYTLILSRDNALCYSFWDKLARYIGVIFRGNEIRIKPETTTYNIFLNK